MSLLEALLTEGYRDPREIYIALRADGQKGIATMDDPYDGGKRLGPALSASLTCNRREFVVGTFFPNNLQVNDQVTITGAKGPGAGWFNITATVQQILSPLHFVLLANHPSHPSDLPPAPPDVQYSWHGIDGIQVTLPTGIQKRVSIYWPIAKVALPPGHGLDVFDGVTMGGASLPADYAGDYPILGPDGSSTNVFAYRLGFLPLADVMDGTTPDHLDCTVNRLQYRFDEVMRNVPAYSVVHIGPGEFETRGSAPMYLAHLTDWTQVHAGFVVRAGQRLLGSGIGATTLKLALPLDEINQTTAIGNFSNQLSTNADYFEASDFTVDCNAPGHAAPYGIFPAPVTCGAVGVRGSFMRLHRVRAIHFCTQGSAECFVLFLPSGWGQPGTFNVIEDCILEQPGLNNTHETTLISSVGDIYGSARSPIVRHNHANCAYVRADGSRNSSAFVAVESITQHATDSELFILVTKTPHRRTGPDANGNVTNNVLINGVTPASNRLNGTFPVVQKDSETQLVLKVVGGAAAGFDASGAYIGVDFHGPSALGGTGCVTEGNAVFDCAQALYADTGSTRDLVVRDNYYSNMLRGVNFDFNPGASGLGGTTDPRTASSVTQGDPPNGKIATFRIPDGTSPLAISVGEVVTVTGVRVDDDPINSYNGTFLVLSVSTDKREFTYEMNSDPGEDADVPASTDPNSLLSFFVRSRYQVRRFIFENNICDLYAFDINSANVSIVPRGMQSIALGGPPFIFPGAVFRDNIFQHLDKTPAVVDANGSYLFALRIVSYGNTLIEGNLIGIENPHTLHYANSAMVTGFNNRTLAGAPLSIFANFGGGSPPFSKVDSLEDRVADALLLSFL